EVSFFFQAEDGIRDLTVTGVQTCALPITLQATLRGPLGLAVDGAGNLFLSELDPNQTHPATYTGPRSLVRKVSADGIITTVVGKIGRASCRERGELAVGGGAGSRTSNDVQ